MISMVSVYEVGALMKRGVLEQDGSFILAVCGQLTKHSKGHD
jgi:hypothetical protein